MEEVHLWRGSAEQRALRSQAAKSGQFAYFHRQLGRPSWRGKKYLELSAFRLGLSPASEMDDHRMYYDVRDLWPMLVAAGFRPRHIRCFPHKFGLNTFAVCRVPKAADGQGT